MRRTLDKKILSVSINLKACEYYHINHKAVAPIVSALIESKLQELMSIHRPWVYIGMQFNLFEWEISMLNLHKYWKPEPVLQFTFNAHEMSDHKVYRNTLICAKSNCYRWFTPQELPTKSMVETDRIPHFRFTGCSGTHWILLILICSNKSILNPALFSSVSFFLACNKVWFVEGEEPTCEEMQISTSSYNMLETYSPLIVSRSLSFWLCLSEVFTKKF